MITSQHQSSTSNTRTQKPSPLPPPPPPPVSLKSTGSQTDTLPSMKPDTTTPHTTVVQSVSIGLQIDLITADKVDVGTQYELLEDVMEIKEEEDVPQPDISEAKNPSSQLILEQTNKTSDVNDVSDHTDKPADSEMIESVQKSLVEISEPESMQDESLSAVDFEIKEIKVEQAPVSSIKVNESKSSSVQSPESDINETVPVVESDIKNESDTSNEQSPPDHSLKETPASTEKEKITSIQVTPTTSSPSISTTASTFSSSISTSSTVTVTPSPLTKRRPLKRPISSLGHSSPDDIHPPAAKALHIDTTSTASSTPPSNTTPTLLSTSSTVSTSTVSNTIAPPSTTPIATSSISTTSSTISTQAPVVSTSSCTVPVSTSEAIVHSPLSDTDDSFSIVSIPVSSITKLPTPKKNPTVVIHSVAPTISDSTNINTTTATTTTGSMLYSTAVAALISPSPLSPISPSPFSPSPISSCPLSPSPVPESPPKTPPKSSPPSPSKSSNSQPTSPIIPPITIQDTTSTVNTESTTHPFTTTTSTATDIICTGNVDVVVVAPSVSTETKSLEPAPSSIETEIEGLQSQLLETVSVLKEEIKEDIEDVHVKEEVFESIKEEEEDEKMETEDGSTGNIFDFTSIPNSKGILPLKPELFQTVSSLSSPHREGSALILSSANPNTITSVPSIEELSSSISSPGGDNLFFPDSAGPHFPPSHSSTPTSPFPSTVIPDENVLLEAVTNELGVDSIDPSLLNMSDLLSLLQPDSDPLDQLALTTEEASSDMIVLQQSDGMNVVQNLDLNINEEELLEGLPQELRDSVQAMLEDQ